MDAAKSMIEAASDAGADGVKFQYYAFTDIADELTNATDLLRHQVFKAQLDLAQLQELRDLTAKFGLAFIITPFKTARKVAEVTALKPDAIKIRYTDGPSNHSDHVGLCNVALATEVSLVMASCTVPPIEIFSLNYNPRMRWLYCIPKYPPALEDFEPARSTGLNGFSDHYPHATAAIIAASLTRFADYIIEKHVMLDGPVDGEKPPDANVSITFNQLAELAQHLRRMEKLKPSEKLWFPPPPRGPSIAKR